MRGTREMFATTTNRIESADLMQFQPLSGESNINYITRWRDMNIRIRYSISEEEEIDFIIKNMTGKAGEWLSMTNVCTYQELIDTVFHMGCANELATPYLR